MARIAVATFQHETNTFAPSKATYAAFVQGGGWPPLTTGAEIPEVVRGLNVPMAGFLVAARMDGHSPVPLVFANATPSAHVTADAFERITRTLLKRLEAAGPVDGVYLDLHGAMVTERYDDGDGEIISRVRRMVGERVPIVCSLDLHANVSPRMFMLADGLVAYRTYPHVDMMETGARAADLLFAILRRGEKPHKEFRRFDFLIPLTAQCTMINPGDKLYGELGKLETQAKAFLSFAPGFPAADVPDCGPTCFGMGFDKVQLDLALETFRRRVADEEENFEAEFLGPEAAVKEAIIASRDASGPVILADTQDNPGAGGNGDSTGLLAAMLTFRVPRALIGLLYDPEAAIRAHQAGMGRELEFSLGARSGTPGVHPVVGKWTVERLSNGEFTCTGPFYRGMQMKLGPMAALRRDDVTLVVSSTKVQAADMVMFTHLGLDPNYFTMIGLKSSVHFRAHFQAIASKIIIVAAPGPNAADPSTLPWARLRRGIRLKPKGPGFGLDEAVA